MSFTATYPYDDAGNYALSDAAKIEISGSYAQLKLLDNTGQTFNQPFTSDSGFTYDNTKAQFIGGKVEQTDQTPANSVLGITYTTDENISWGQQAGTGTLLNGASVSGGFLDVTGGATESAYYSGLSLPSNAGAVKLIFKPGFSGAPGVDGYVFASTGISQFYVLISGAGNIRFIVKNDAGTQAIDTASGVVAWVNGQEYEILVNWNVSGNIGNIYIDGTRVANETSFTGSRTSVNTGLNIGAYEGSVGGVNGSIKDVVIYNTVQESDASYTPGYTLPETQYVSSKVECPQFSYSGGGAVQAFTNFVTTETGVPTYILNDLYWDGAAWSSSNGTRAQSSPVANVTANIASLPASDTLDIDIWFSDSNTQEDLDDLTVTYTGQIYPTDDPYVEPNATIYCDKIDGITEIATKTGNDEVKYVVKADSKFYWISGGVITETVGNLYSESNTVLEWDAIWPVWDPDNAVNIKYRAFLHSDNGTTAPLLDENTISYDYRGTAPDELSKCIVFGYSKKPDGTVNTEKIKAYLNVGMTQYKTNTTINNSIATVAPNSDDGYWELELIENDNMEDGVKYFFEIDDKLYERTVPNQPSANFWTLT